MSVSSHALLCTYIPKHVCVCVRRHDDRQGSGINKAFNHARSQLDRNVSVPHTLPAAPSFIPLHFVCVRILMEKREEMKVMRLLF